MNHTLSGAMVVGNTTSGMSTLPPETFAGGGGGGQEEAAAAAAGGQEVSQAERVIEATLLSLIATLALVGNTSLWLIICRDRSLRTTSNALILCLSTADLLVSAINMPVTVVTIVVGDWFFSSTACVVFGFITMVTFIASVMSLGVISINRFVLICYPVHFKLLYTPLRTGLMIVGTWILSISLASPPLLGWGRYDYLPNQSFCFCDWTTSFSYTIFMVAACFGGPVSVMTFCYIGILRKVRASHRKVQQTGMMGSPTAASPPSAFKPSAAVVAVPSAQACKPALPAPAPVNRHSAMGPGGGGAKASRTLQPPLLSPNPAMKLSLPGEKPACPTRLNLLTGHGALATSSSTESCADAPVAEYAPPSPADDRADPPLNGTAKGEGLSPKKGRGGGGGGGGHRRRQEDLRLTITLLVIIAIFVVCWLPFCITMFLNVFWHRPVPRIPDITTLLLGCFNSSCNPLIYGVMNKRFWNGYRRLFCLTCERRTQGHTDEYEQATAQTWRETLQASGRGRSSDDDDDDDGTA